MRNVSTRTSGWARAPEGRTGDAPFARGTLALLLASACLTAGCEGDDGNAGPTGGGGPTPTSTTVERGEDPPGIRLAVVRLSGGSGPGASFRVGDRITVTFTIEKDDGDAWHLDEMTAGAALVSGPSFNYNRVLPETTDLLAASVHGADGSYTYSFPAPIPSVYAPPYNDTPSFGPGDGELSGMPLLDGTYTVGLYVRWDYTVDGEPATDAGNATMDFLLGSPRALAPRELVTQENCNRCHADLRAHGGAVKDVTLCLLCHTSGAEDENAGGATPGESIDFRVMIHKLHSGRHLPSVLGVGTNPDGTRDYAAPAKPYVLVGDEEKDYSHVAFPVLPNLETPLPRDTGYGLLAPSEQALEDAMLAGIGDCATCHGDPDGAGPAPAPSQGALIYTQSTRRACGSCHDDVDWALPYRANMETMPPQTNDALCIFCHRASGTNLAVMDGHRHPLLDPMVNPGLVFDVTEVAEGAGGNLNDAIDVGEGIRVTMTVQDDSGADVDPSTLASRNLVIHGPTSNANLLLNTPIPAEALTGPQPFVFSAPEGVLLELAGDSDPGTGGEVFTTARAPHWNGPTSATRVYARAPTFGGTALSAPASVDDNFVDVLDASGFQDGDVIVLDDALPASEEHLRVQWIEGNRLWFASPAQPSLPPALRRSHGAGASVQVADLTMLAEGVDYGLDPVLGTITESAELGDVAVIVSYTTDFRVPATYGPALNASPDLDETAGKWTGKSVADGTYTLAVWGHRDLAVDVLGEITPYQAASPAGSVDFTIGGALLEPYRLIDSPARCDACHEELWYHGGTARGFESCRACHGTAGAEDRPRYRSSGAPETNGVQVSFRELLHKIHMGAALTNAGTYTVVGEGPGAPPDDFRLHTYSDVELPSQPGAAGDCAACHGDAPAWRSPGDRDHPTEQGLPVRSWTAVCGSCHDDATAGEHFDSHVSRGIESCSICHDVGETWSVERTHAAY